MTSQDDDDVIEYESLESVGFDAETAKAIRDAVSRIDEAKVVVRRWA